MSNVSYGAARRINISHYKSGIWSNASTNERLLLFVPSSHRGHVSIYHFVGSGEAAGPRSGVDHVTTSHSLELCIHFRVRGD